MNLKNEEGGKASFPGVLVPGSLCSSSTLAARSVPVQEVSTRTRGSWGPACQHVSLTLAL